MASVLKNLLNKLKTKKDFEYHDLGKVVIWEELHNLILTKKYKYYHYDPKFDGTRDKDGEWIDSTIIFSNQHINYEDEKNMIFYVFYSSGMDDQVKRLSESELLSKDWNYTKFLKRALLE